MIPVSQNPTAGGEMTLWRLMNDADEFVQETLAFPSI